MFEIAFGVTFCAFFALLAVYGLKHEATRCAGVALLVSIGLCIPEWGWVLAALWDGGIIPLLLIGGLLYWVGSTIEWIVLALKAPRLSDREDRFDIP